jgi:hypothetical protein
MLKKPAAAFSLRSEAQRTEAYAFASSLAAAFLDGLFEHPAQLSPVVIDMRTIARGGYKVWWKS